MYSRALRTVLDSVQSPCHIIFAFYAVFVELAITETG